MNGSGCSDTALVTLSNDASLCPPIIEKITISPNPVVDKLNIAVTKKTAATIEIIIHNILGQKVYSNTYHQPIGLQTYTIPMKQMASGIYYIVLMIDGKKEAEKKIMNR
ncbi:MAG: T9SS type A sorting domain-containing protein [Ferruginibacter sp.]